jgi:hypothetical protein
MCDGGIPSAPPRPCDASRVSDYTTPGLLRWRSLTDAPLLVLAIGSLPLQLHVNEL